MTEQNSDNKIHEDALNAMTSDMESIHRDLALPAMRSAVAEWAESLKAGATKTPNRRTFLLGGATLGAGGAVLAACGSSSKKAVTSTSPTTAASSTSPTTMGGTSSTTMGGSGGQLTGDLAVAGLAAGLENLAVYAYKASIAAATAGKFGKVPPAVVTFAETAMAQHQDHADGWNAAIKAAGKTPVTTPLAKLTPMVQTAFGKVKNLTELAELALMLENSAAQTYQAAISELKMSTSIEVAATIQPVEMQHAAILYYVLGRYPGIQGTASNDFAQGSPLAFNPTALAVS